MKKYQVIYADPPWSYKDKSKSHGGGAESHYKCLSVSEMLTWSLPASDNSVLLMWCTYPMLNVGLELMAGWGFTFKTVAFTWVKVNKDGSVYMGMGRHTRGNAEICLLGTKGKGVKRLNCSIYNTQLHRRGKHSEKPAKFRDDIVKLYGAQTSRLEMFARINVKGWDSWGDEIECTTKILTKTKGGPCTAG